MKKYLILIAIFVISLLAWSENTIIDNSAEDDDGFGYARTFTPDENVSWTISELFDDDVMTYIYQEVQFDTALLNESYYMNFMYPSVISGVSNTSEFGYFFPWGLKNGFILTRHDSDSLYSEPYYRFTEVFWGNYVINYKYGDYNWKIGLGIDPPINSQYVSAYSRPGQWYGELKREPYLSQDTANTVYREEFIKIIDDIPPTIHLQTPADSSYISGDQTISLLIMDNAHASYASYNINDDILGDTIFYNSSSMEPMTVEYNFSSEGGHEYVIAITAKDAWSGVGLLGNETSKTFSLVNPIYYISNIYQNEVLIGEEYILKSYEPDLGIYSNEIDNENISNTQLFSPVTVQYVDNDNAVFFKTNLEIKYDAFPYMPKANPEMNLLIEWNNGIKGKGNKGRIEYENINLESTILLEIFHQKDKCIIEELGNHDLTLKTKLSDRGMKYNEEEIVMNSIHLFDRDANWNKTHSLFNELNGRNIMKVPNWFHYWRLTDIFSAYQLEGGVAWYDDDHSYNFYSENLYGFFCPEEDPTKYFIRDGNTKYAIKDYMMTSYANQDEQNRIINEQDILEDFGDIDEPFRFNGINAFAFICFHECGHKNDFWEFWPSGVQGDVSADYDRDKIPDVREPEYGFCFDDDDTNNDGLSDFEELQYRQHINRLKLICINKIIESSDYAFPGAKTKWNNPYSY